MLRLAFTLSLGLLTVGLFAQNPKLDSLRQRAAALPDGKEKSATLLAFAKGSMSHAPKTAFEAADEAVRISKKIGDAESVVKGRVAQSEFYRQAFQYAEAQRHSDEAIRWAEQAGDSLLLATALFEKAACFESEGKMAENVRVSERALGISEKKGRKPTFLAGRYCKLGTDLRNVGEFDRALDYCRRGLALYQQHKVPAGECYALTGISLIYAKMGDYAQALEMEEKSLAVSQKSGDQYRQAVSYHNIGEWHFRLGNFEKALEASRQISALNHLLQDIAADIELYKLRGRIFYAMHDMKQAQSNYEKALDIALRMKNPFITAGVWRDMTPVLIELKQTQRVETSLRALLQDLAGTSDSLQMPRIRMALGEVKAAQGAMDEAAAIFTEAAAWYEKKEMLFESGEASVKLADMQLRANQPDQALATARRSLASFEKARSKTDIAAAHLLLYRAYKQKADYANALLHHEQHFLYLDSVKTQDLRRRLAEERVKQNVEDIEAERARAERETQLLATRNRLYLALGAVLLAALLVGAYLFWKLQKAKNLLAAQHLQLAQLNQTKDKFFGIIAHDLRSPLAAFQGVGEQFAYFLEKGDTAKLHKISALLTQSAASLSGLLDNLLSWALLNRGMIPYHPEPLALADAVAENFQVYEYAAAAKGIRLLNQAPPHIRVKADRNALLAILRNLVGNAVKFTPAHQDGCVSVGCEERDGKVFITVNDTGTGIAAEKLDRLFDLEKRPERGTAGEKGAGLGLLLCRELVELHKGVLRVFSTAGQGATFEFSLPTT